MNILISNFNKEKRGELIEYLSSHEYEVYSADNDLEAVNILNNNQVQKVLINVTKILHFGLINYINNHFPEIDVLMITNNYVEQAVSLLKNCTCSIVREPLTLSVLGQKLLA